MTNRHFKNDISAIAPSASWGQNKVGPHLGSISTGSRVVVFHEIAASLVVVVFCIY
jgi:hypothetical protein